MFFVYLTLALLAYATSSEAYKINGGKNLNIFFIKVNGAYDAGNDITALHETCEKVCESNIPCYWMCPRFIY